MTDRPEEDLLREALNAMLDGVANKVALVELIGFTSALSTALAVMIERLGGMDDLREEISAIIDRQCADMSQRAEPLLANAFVGGMQRGLMAASCQVRPTSSS